MDDHLKQLLRLGREHYEKRDFGKAESVFQEVLSICDRFPDVFDMLGVIAHSRGDYALAERNFEKAVSLNPNYTEAQLNLMVTYNDLGKYDLARAVHAKIRHRAREGEGPVDPFARGKIANMHADLSQAYLDAGMPDGAIAELERAVALCPEFVDLRTRLATLYRDNGEPERAKTELEFVLASNPEFVPARVALGALLLSAGDHATAIRELESALASDAGNKSAQMYLRFARAERGHSEAPPAPASAHPSTPPPG